MAGPLSTDDVVEAALKGVVLAQKDYELWSEEWLWCAPEYLTTVYVARAISKLSAAKYVTLENSASATIGDAGARGRGRLHFSIRENGRFDILLWWANGTPRAPIEVKTQVLSIEKIRADLERIEKVVLLKKSESSIGFGIVAFYASCKGNHTFSAKQKLEQSLANIERDGKGLVGGTCTVSLRHSRIQVVEDSAWVAAALLVRPKSI